MQLVMFGTTEEPVKRPRGRPRWEKAKEYQELVECLVDWGLGREEIAQAVGVSGETLAHYFSETASWKARWGNRKRRTTDDHRT